MSNFYSSRKPKNIRQHNQKMILSLLQLVDEISISELSEKTNLSKTTISKMFADLCHAGILLSAGKGESTSDGGKKPELFALNPEYGYTIVLSIIQPDRIVCSLTGLLGRVRYSRTEDLDPEAGYPALLSGILRAITQTLGETGVPTDQIMGIAVACSGIVNTNTGTLLYPTHEPWGTHLPLREDIRKELAFPVDIFIDTAHRFSAYAEFLFEENRKNNPVIVISTKYFLVGASLLTKQKLVPGYDGVVGDFGHIIIDPHSPKRCACGRHGCLATLVGENTLLERASMEWQKYPASPVSQKFLSGSLAPRDIFAAASQGDPFGQSLVDYLVDIFSILIHNLISLNSAKRVVLQGFFASEGDYFLQRLREKVLNFNRFRLCGNIHLDYSQLDLSSDYREQEPYILGASLSVSNHHFDTLIL